MEPRRQRDLPYSDLLVVHGRLSSQVSRMPGGQLDPGVHGTFSSQVSRVPGGQLDPSVHGGSGPCVGYPLFIRDLIRSTGFMFSSREANLERNQNTLHSVTSLLVCARTVHTACHAHPQGSEDSLFRIH